MARVVLIANEKGGVGKTTIAHTLALMCSYATLAHDPDRHPSVAVIETDLAGRAARVVDPSEIRPYTTFVGSDALLDVLEAVSDQDDVVVIVDGGANRWDTSDHIAAAAADLIVVPVKASVQDLDHTRALLAKIAADAVASTKPLRVVLSDVPGAEARRATYLQVDGWSEFQAELGDRLMTHQVMNSNTLRGMPDLDREISPLNLRRAAEGFLPVAEEILTAARINLNLPTVNQVHARRLAEQNRRLLSRAAQDIASEGEPDRSVPGTA